MKYINILFVNCKEIRQKKMYRCLMEYTFEENDCFLLIEKEGNNVEITIAQQEYEHVYDYDPDGKKYLALQGPTIGDPILEIECNEKNVLFVKTNKIFQANKITRPVENSVELSEYIVLENNNGNVFLKGKLFE